MHFQHNLGLTTYCNKNMDESIMPIGTINFTPATHIDCYALSTVLVYNILDDFKARNSEGLISTVESIIVKSSKVTVYIYI